MPLAGLIEYDLLCDTMRNLGYVKASRALKLSDAVKIPRSWQQVPHSGQMELWVPAWVEELLEMGFKWGDVQQASEDERFREACYCEAWIRSTIDPHLPRYKSPHYKPLRMVDTAVRRLHQDPDFLDAIQAARLLEPPAARKLMRQLVEETAFWQSKKVE